MPYTQHGDGLELPAFVALTSRFDGSQRLYGLKRHGPFAMFADMWPVDGGCMTSEVSVAAVARQLGTGELRPCSLI